MSNFQLARASSSAADYRSIDSCIFYLTKSKQWLKCNKMLINATMLRSELWPPTYRTEGMACIAIYCTTTKKQ